MADGLLVITPGLHDTVQDAGRTGSQRFGVSVAGAVDAVSHRIANLLVGNPPEAATLECTMSGGVFEVEADRCRIALAGADMPIEVAGRHLIPYAAHVLRRGDRLRIGTAKTGLRAYLAVAGGIDVPPVLGSRSTQTRARLGGIEGRALRAGDRLPIGVAGPAPLLALPEAAWPRFDGPVRVLPGPQADAFTAAGMETFLSATYTVSVRSDRMACQLDGPAIEHADGFNIVSDGIVNGSIQVPGHGRPIVLLADRQTTGGYPKIATVLTADLPKLAQRRPGDSVTFTAVDAAEAEAAYLAFHRDQAAWADRLVELAEGGGAADLADRLHHVNLISGVVSATA